MEHISPLALEALSKSKRRLREKYNIDLSFESIDDIYNLKVLAKSNDKYLQNYYNVFMYEMHKSPIVKDTEKQAA